MKHKKRALLKSALSLLLCVAMLTGTTFAWFTDSVVSGYNTIAAGNLDVALHHSNAAVTDEPVDSTTKLFMDLQGNPILWEPGVVSYENLRVTNEGDLALAYQLSVNTANENYIVDPSGAQYGLSRALKVGVVEGGITTADRAGILESVKETGWYTLESFLRGGALLPEGEGVFEKTWGVVIYWEPGENDNLLNLNNGKQLNEGDVLSIDLGIKLVATQEGHESDVFGDDYDSDAKPEFFPDFMGGTSSIPVVVNEQYQTVSESVKTFGKVTVTVPAGVQLTAGTTALPVSIGRMGGSNANVELGENEILRSLDVHVGGVSGDNQTPITVSLQEAAPKGLNMGNYKLFHVEADGTKEMTLVAAADAFTAHNQFKYDPATGDLTLYMASFSEVAVVADTENKWEGKFDYNWYDADATELTIANADQLAAFGAIVGGMNGQTADSFAGKTVKLLSDINLGDKNNANENLIFHPIGYYYTDDKNEDGTTGDYYSTVSSFEGTFDGNGHTIANFYQNTWEIKGDYDGNYYDVAMGLFGYVVNGTVKNLTVDNFSSDGEFTPTGVIAAYAVNSTFANIAITNCNPRVYNTGNGGIVGIGGNSDDPDTYKLTFNNITIDNTNKITALWGSWDVACGGLVGMFRGAGHVHMTNCHVAAQIDVYNDVCGNYQYYWYRYSGMMVGTNKNMITDKDGYTVPETSKFHAENCTVHFGDWNDYYYCELVANSLASYTHDHQFSRLTEISSLDEIKSGDTWTKSGNFLLISGDTKTCYHIVKDSNGSLKQHLHADAGTETVNGVTVLKEDNQIVYLPFNQLFTGYGWGVKHIPVFNGENYAFEGITILDREEAKSEVKFAKADTAKDSYTTESTVTIGELFKAAEINDKKLTIKGDKVQVTVSPVGEDSTAGGTYAANTTDWTQGTLTFTGTGAASITITDYYFCKPTTITVNVVARQPEVKFETKFTGDFLYRVGNKEGSTVALDTLFTGKNVTGTVDVSFETIAGNASGAYASNATWTNGTIQFSGTGVVKVTITDNDYCTPTELYLEVVDAKNVTTADSARGEDVVLLKGIKVTANGTINYSDCTVYGNGFEIDVCGGMNQYNSKQGHGIIIAKNATLDHLRIVGDVYDEYGMYTSSLTGAATADYTSAVDATNCTIQNCYIANCAAPIRSIGTTISDTTLYGGTIANLLISGGTNTLTNVTTVNYKDGRGVIGMGIVITDGATPGTTKLILNGYLKQHNYIYETDISEIKLDEAKTVFKSMFANQFSEYHIGSNPKAVNTGIVSINDDINLDEDVFTDNANTGYDIKNDVTITISASGVNTTVNAAVASTPKNGNVNNDYKSKDTHQGDYLPTFDFNLGDQLQPKDNDDDTRYLIGDKNGLTAMYPKGESALTLDLTKLATATKYTNTFYSVTAKCICPNGKEQTGTVTLSDKGTYTLVFTIEDDIFYDQNGNKVSKSVTRTYKVPLVLDIYEKSIADATMTISNAALTGEYITSGTNKKYKMYPLKAITSIMDDANKDGVLESFDFKKNIQSAVLTPESNNAFSSPTTITVTYTGGQVLTIVLGTPSGLNSPGASNGGKTFSVKTDSTNGIYLQSDGAVASSSAATGTWPLTSWSFKGTSGKVITDNTKVTINFTKPSGCFTAGTLITLADGTQKPIEQITYADQLLAWDFHTGEYAVTVPSLIEAHEVSQNRVINLRFADGTKVRIVVDHGFFDVEENNFVFFTEENVENYIGHTFVKANGDGTYSTTKLANAWVTIEYIDYYTIQTAKYNNCVAESMFTLTAPPEGVDGWFDYFEIGKGMKYDEAKMKADIEKYGLYDYSEFAEFVTYEQFIAFNGPYLKVLVGRGVVTFEGILELIATYVNP